MLAVERNIINSHHKCWSECDDLTFKSKNLYNLANYHVRQNFFKTGYALPLSDIYQLVKATDAYTALPRKVSNQVLIQVRHDWSAYFQAIDEYRENPEKFKKQPRIPKYKHKTEGRNIVTYEKGAVSKTELKKGICKPSKTSITVPTTAGAVKEARVVPLANCYVIEVVYERLKTSVDGLNPKLIAGIDLGLDNLGAVATNKAGFTPILINRRPLKAINQFYNKRISYLQQRQSKTNSPRKFTRQMREITHKRNCQIDSYLHNASRLIINDLVANGIGTLVVGYNSGWKDEIKMGKLNNQKFVQIPYWKFVQMLTYKAQLLGIIVMIAEESYTSKTSFLDMEPVQKHEEYQGLRVKRGLFKASKKRRINADVNASYNIIRKVFGNSVFALDSIVAYAVRPVRVHPLAKPKNLAALLNVA